MLLRVSVVLMFKPAGLQLPRASRAVTALCLSSPDAFTPMCLLTAALSQESSLASGDGRNPCRDVLE